MKKVYLAVLLACSIGGSASAQISEGGIPWSMVLSNGEMVNQAIKPISLKSPDYSQALKEDEANAALGVSKPYRAGLIVNADITLLNSGNFSYLKDGKIIWKAKVILDEAMAVNFYYDQFNLPAGVKYFITNSNGKQILGAFSRNNNSDDGLFATSEIQGNIVNLELNIEKGVDISLVKFHINAVGAFYRGENNLTHFYGDNNGESVLKPTGSSPCQINAMCPAGSSYSEQRKATAHILIRDPDANALGFCTGTLINSTGNSASGVCKPYLLTATHCDEENGRTDNHFSQWIFTFNNEAANCDGTGGAPTNQSILGANFRARSNYTSFPQTPGGSLPLVSDFLLLEMKSAIPQSYGAYLSGWNRNTDLALDPNADFFIGFHHPAGDIKKLSTSLAVDGAGQFNQTIVPATHWTTNFNVGGTEPGSSGSGLFDKKGLLIGDLSGGPEGTGLCSPMGTIAEYSKISYGWENAFDQTTFPAFAGSSSRLKDWLDPINSGLKTFITSPANCSNLTVGIDENNILDNSLMIYPNPSTNGKITMKFNLPQSMEIKVKVYNVLGSLVKDITFKGVHSGNYLLDLSFLGNGNYILNFSTPNETVGKKLTIIK